jgi:hypothetical protein
VSKESSVLAIDEHDLVGECSRHPQTYHEWADALATAKNDVDRKKAAMELVEAQVFARVRENPSAYGLEAGSRGPGVDAVKFAVTASRQFQQAQEAYLSAREEEAKIEVVVRGLEHKKRMLEQLVVLRTTDYYSDPAVPRKVRDAVDADRRKRVARAVTEDS